MRFPISFTLMSEPDPELQVSTDPICTVLYNKISSCKQRISAFLCGTLRKEIHTLQNNSIVHADYW